MSEVLGQKKLKKEKSHKLQAPSGLTPEMGQYRMNL